MLYYITLVLVFWALIYTAARFLQYYRIVKNYKEETQAVVKQIREHTPAGRKEPPALDSFPMRSAEKREVPKSLSRVSRRRSIRPEAGWESAIMWKTTVLCILQLPAMRRERSCTLIWRQ